MAALDRAAEAKLTLESEFGPSTYGDSFADVYDRRYANVSDVEATVDAIESLAGGRPVLELGVGTGRIALPLARRGVEVHGIDASAAMLDLLAQAHDSHLVNDRLGDMAALESYPDGSFGVIFATWNTFFNLDSAAAQQRCLQRCAEVLVPGGRLAIEVFVPSPEPKKVERQLDVVAVELDRVELVATSRDPELQIVTGQNIEMTEAGNRLRPWRIRYASPSQLDALAAAAGLSLEHRYQDWRNSAFDKTSAHHVSHYRKPS